jgi:hypothetical protein
MKIRVMGHEHNLGEVEPDPNVLEYCVADLLSAKLSVEDKKIIKVLMNPKVKHKPLAVASALFNIPEHAVHEDQVSIARSKIFTVLEVKNR